LLYVLIFAVLLITFSVSLYMLIRRDARSRFDLALTNTALTFANLFHQELIENEQLDQVATAHALREYQQANFFFAIFNNDRLLAASQNKVGDQPSPQDRPAAAAAKSLLAEAISRREPILATNSKDGREEWRLVAYAPKGEATNYVVVAAESTRELSERLRAVREIFLLSLPAILLLAGLAGYLLARGSLAPITEMAEQAERISAENLHERLPVKNKSDELGRLARVFNDLLSRIEGSFDGIRRFTADASHELRTPLAIIRGEADVALTQDRDPAEYRETLSIIQDEARRLSRLVEDMLALARADAGQRGLTRQKFYINDLIEECVRSTRALAGSKNLTLDAELCEDVSFFGDEDLFRRLILNLLDNAIKYTPEGGKVAIKLWRENDRIKLRVTDNGIGIPAEAVARVFERFYRVDKARSRAEGGSGLGLPIVKWIAEAHQGSVSLESAPDRGASFTVSLPA
jgi:heavy metal sensor kinase